MIRAVILSLVSLSNLGCVLGTSIYEAYPGLKDLVLSEGSGHEWHTTDEWRCPWFHPRNLKTELSVIKTGRCSHESVKDRVKGPALSCCNIGGRSGPTCDYTQSLSYSKSRSTTLGWKVGIQAKFGDAKVTGEYTASFDLSGSVTETAANSSGQTLGWRNLEPGYYYIPKIAYLKFRCSGIVYKDNPWIEVPEWGGYMYMSGYSTDPPKNVSPKKWMSLWTPEDRTCGIRGGAYWYGYHDVGTANPGAVALQQTDRTYKMSDDYRNKWSETSVEFPVLDEHGEILSVYDLEKIPCSSAFGLEINEDGYVELPPAIFPEATDLSEEKGEEQAAFHGEL
ncbi:hypothetical protein NUU61_003331 [Penicillium alfredii]|uniref:Uncharacterized protein n=1 Tax=Penicillium alfredii TaxID=1506179 RepID=A0A9W9FT92_9EURO|nr:uncharacterized protein NUU61_003331 [Penicillium alfredii]KAJ5105984.1 hypothetical protein NUU61_003331 [Penicillium alfredii]